MPYWVVAEISELKVNYSGHCYLELVEKGGDNQVPKAKANAVIWRSQYSMIGSYFKTATGGELCAGIKVLVKVSVSYHELYGLSFQITDIEPSYTLGDIEAQRRETIDRLKKEGIYDMNRETELPDVLQRLAVISSQHAAGYQDFMNELGANAPGYDYHITLFQTAMQGNETEPSVIHALDAIAERLDDFDAVIVIRGGGSQSDLAAFNSYRLTSHLAQFPLPVLTGIGHDKDQSVADLVAHTALKTPTAVATFLTAHNELFEGRLNEMLESLLDLAQDQLRDEQLRLTALGHQLKIGTSDRIRREEKKLADLLPSIHYRAKLTIEGQKGYCRLLATNLAHAPKGKLSEYAHGLQSIQLRLSEQVRYFLSNQKQQLALLEIRLEGKNLERILQMGYALVRGAQGHIVKSLADVNVDDTLSVQLRDGTVEAQVHAVKQKKGK